MGYVDIPLDLWVIAQFLIFGFCFVYATTFSIVGYRAAKEKRESDHPEALQ